MIEVRCENRLFGLLPAHGVLEVKCNSRWCGAKPGVVVLHRFDTATGELIETARYKDPAIRRH